VDISNDGHPDIISGSCPGEIFLFRGTEGRSFEAPEMIKDKNGRFINIGEGIRKSTMFNPWGGEQPEGLLIAGIANFERTPEGTFVNYHGQRLESTNERPIAITGTSFETAGRVRTPWMGLVVPAEGNSSHFCGLKGGFHTAAVLKA